ncbi:AAA family ATPase [Streptosporangium jomthongense]|uniref:AAA family ATPase n=1 Tax=Streptosporangium jomthongense TaxID=1193683 RepID=A0ABV8F2S3_9ACTN
MSDASNVKLKAAIKWSVCRGYHVFPYDHVTGKAHIRYRTGQDSATTDYEQILKWWNRWPDAGVTADLKKSHYVTVDVDGKDGKPGYASLEKWESEYGLLSRETEHHKSRSGEGEHLTYVIPERYRGHQLTNRISPNGYPGLDFVLNTLHLPTSEESVINDMDPVEAPEFLMEWLVSQPKADKPSTVQVEKPTNHDRLSEERKAFCDSETDKVIRCEVAELKEALRGDAWNQPCYNFATRIYELAYRYPESYVGPAEADSLIDKHWPTPDGGNWSVANVEKTRNSARETVRKKLSTEGYLAFKAGELDFASIGDLRKEVYRQELRSAFVNDRELGDIEERTFLWEDRIVADSFCLLQGDGGAGKGSFTVWVMSELSHGRLPGAHYGKPTKSCFVSSEDSYKQDVKPRLKAQGYREGFIEFIDRERMKTDGTLLLTDMKSEVLIEECARRKCRVLVLDPVGDFFPDELNPDNRKDVRKVLRHLQDLGARHGVTVIGIIHENKSNTGSAADKGGGTKAFRDVARSGFRLAVGKNKDGEEVRTASHLKSNYSALQNSFIYHIEEAWVAKDNGERVKTSKFVLGPSTEETADDIAESQTMSRAERSFANKETVKAKIALLKKLLEAGEEGIEPSDGKLLAEALGVSTSTMRQKALGELINDGIAENTGSRGKAGKWRLLDKRKAEHYLREVDSHMSKDLGIPM